MIKVSSIVLEVNAIELNSSHGTFTSIVLTDYAPSETVEDATFCCSAVPLEMIS